MYSNYFMKLTKCYLKTQTKNHTDVRFQWYASPRAIHILNIIPYYIKKRRESTIYHLWAIIHPEHIDPIRDASWPITPLHNPISLVETPWSTRNIGKVDRAPLSPKLENQVCNENIKNMDWK